MRDFFDDLERQLVAATPQRRARLRRARVRRTAAIGSVLVALLAGGAGIAVAVGGDEQDGHGAAAGHAATTSAPPPATTTAPPARGTFVVAILNGTAVPGLARGVANRLQNAKYKIGNVTNAAAQNRATTLVEYAPGHRAEADRVAQTIDVRPDAIQPLSAASKTIAGDAATVVVTVGSDQNTSPSP
jgi:hypothetical protein